MNNTILPAAPVLSEVSNVSVCAPGTILKKLMVTECEVVSYSTTYGSVLTFTNGADALSSGSGICIGDYFVGLADNPHLPPSSTYIRY